MSTINNQPLTRLNIFSLKGVQMKTFHITWLTFFFCFFAWFGIAPLMPLVSESLHLTKAQKGNVAIAAVSATIIARLIIGRLTDKYGPRKVYTWLLVICAFPVIFIGLADSYITFLLFQVRNRCNRRFICINTVSYIGDVCTQYKRYSQCNSRWIWKYRWRRYTNFNAIDRCRISRSWLGKQSG